MPFVNCKASQQKEYQQTVWDILFLKPARKKEYLINPESNTVTKYYTKTPEQYKKYNVQQIINNLSLFNNTYKYLCENLEQHYAIAYIPKKTKTKDGRQKYRKISMPSDELSNAQKTLKSILELGVGGLYHTSAFAYIPKRSAQDVSKKHKYNQSQYWLLTDFHDFFGSITYKFTLRMLSEIYPFDEIMSRPDGQRELKEALKVCFLNNGLPQGTPISPMLTNLVMLPFDYMLSKALRERYVYTRYADDIQISSRHKFNKMEVLNIISDIIKRLNAPFQIAPEKTKFRKGAIFVLGVMYNEKGERTVGHKNKKSFKAMLFNYLTDKANGRRWQKEDIQALLGNYSYYHSIEPKYFQEVLKHYSQQFKFDVMLSIKEDLRNVDR